MAGSFVKTLSTSAVVVGAGFAGAGCGHERPPHFEDAARATVPVPACVVSLPPRAHAQGLRNLTEDEVWHVLFPRYDSAKHELPLGAEACTGERVFEDPILAGAPMQSPVVQVKENDIIFGNAGDRVRIVWLRTHRWPDGSEGGPLALVRATETSAEVYAIGVHKRAPSKSTFQAERVGAEMLVTAIDDGCEDQPKTALCSSNVTIFQPHYGHLARLRSLVTELRAQGSGTEPGVIGTLQYKLIASPEYGSSGVKVFEEIEATDQGGRVVHKMDLERNFTLKDGTLDGGPDSLWSRVQAQTQPAAASAKTPPEPKAPPKPAHPAPAQQPWQNSGFVKTPSSMGGTPDAPSRPSVPSAPSSPEAPSAPSAPSRPSAPSAPSPSPPSGPSVPSGPRFPGH